jgi:hypothetical protein
MRIFADQNLEFHDKLGDKPFVLKHNLAECELFDLARLEDLGTAVIRARRDGRAREALVTVFDAEAASVESWTPEDRSKSTPARVVNKLESTAANAVKISPEVQLAEAFRRINDKEFRSWIKLTSVNEVDLDYDAIRRQAIEELSEFTGLSPAEITWSHMTIFISSPGIVTPFHNDAEQNFLLQLRGSKDVCLYPQDDPFLVPQEALENLYKGDGLAARYREEFAKLGTQYHLEPGLGVHHPALAPHTVKNGPQVSVSAAIAFTTLAMDDRARIHQVNWLFRRMGLKPRRPGLSGSSDRIKVALMRRISGPRVTDPDLTRGMRRLLWPAKVVRDTWKKLHSVR